LIRCHAGCDQKRVIAALRSRGLWDARGQREHWVKGPTSHAAANHWPDRDDPKRSLVPAMVAAVRGPPRLNRAIHRTYLRADGAGKAGVSSPHQQFTCDVDELILDIKAQLGAETPTVIVIDHRWKGPRARTRIREITSKPPTSCLRRFRCAVAKWRMHGDPPLTASSSMSRTDLDQRLDACRGTSASNIERSDSQHTRRSPSKLSRGRS